jgi:hypothetical protein
MVEIEVGPHVDEVPVVDAGSANAVLIDTKAQLANEMQRRGGRGAEAGDVAGVGRNLRLHQDDVQGWFKWLGAEARRGGKCLRHPFDAPGLTLRSQTVASKRISRLGIGTYLRRPIKVAVVASLAILAPTRSTPAAGLDPAERLITPGLPAGTPTQQVAQNPSEVLALPFAAEAVPNNYPCLPNNVARASFMSEPGMAIVRECGLDAERETAEARRARNMHRGRCYVNASAGGLQYWHLGARGAIDLNTHQFSAENTKPDSMIQVYSLRARKGLACGFEVVGNLGFVANTSPWVSGADLRWARPTPGPSTASQAIGSGRCLSRPA